MTAPIITPPSPTVTVQLVVLQSILDSALTSSVRHVAAGLPDNTRAVLFARRDELLNLTLTRVLASLAASGCVHRLDQGIVPEPARPEVV